MSDIGFSELLLVLTIALIVIGPKRLPEAARFLGYWTGRIRRAIQAARSDMERELGLDDVRREVHNQLRMEELERERKEVEATFQRTQTRPRPPAALPPPPDESDFIDDSDFIDKTDFIDKSDFVDKGNPVDKSNVVEKNDLFDKPPAATPDTAKPAPATQP